MTLFHYIAVDDQGCTVSGTVEAADWQSAEAVLVSRGLRDVRSTANLVADTSPEVLGTSDAVELARYLTQLAKSGLPLGGGLRAIAQDLPPGRLARAIDRLAGQIEAGQSLSSAIESFGTRLPPHMRELMVAGARSGNVAETLDGVLSQEGQLDDFGRQLRQAVGYPIVLLMFLLAWLLFIALWLIPAMLSDTGSLLQEFSTDVPLVTRYLIAFSRVVPCVILAIGIVSFAIIVADRTERGAAVVSRLWSGLPWIGPAWWYRGLVEFCGLMGVFLEQGMPLPESLRLTSLSSRDAAMRRACRRIADQTDSGHALSTCLADNGLFPATLASTVAWGETHTALAESLQSAREMFCERLESQIELIRLIVPSMVFLLLGASGLFVAAGFINGVLRMVVDLS